MQLEQISKSKSENNNSNIYGVMFSVDITKKKTPVRTTPVRTKVVKTKIFGQNC